MGARPVSRSGTDRADPHALIRRLRELTPDYPPPVSRRREEGGAPCPRQMSTPRSGLETARDIGLAFSWLESLTRVERRRGAQRAPTTDPASNEDQGAEKHKLPRPPA